MLEVTLKGKPYEIGLAYGRSNPDLVKESIFKVFRIREKYSGESFYKKILRDGENRLKLWHPDFVEEMRGIADGCGVEYEDVLAHNLYSYFALYIYLMKLKNNKIEYSEKCSCAGLLSEKDGPIIGKNNDATPGEKYHILAKYFPEGKNSFIHYTYIGMVGTVAGMNKKGLTIGGASVSGTPPFSWDKDLIFVFQVIRYWLEEFSTIDEVLKSAESLKIYSSANLLVADLSKSENRLVHLEYVSPNYVAVRKPVNGQIWCTNHPLSEKLKRIQVKRKEDEASWKNSEARYKTIGKLINEVPQNAEGIKQVMSSHTGPARICQHNGIQGAVMDTDVSSVFVPKKHILYISHGHPCEVGYKKVIF